MNDGNNLPGTQAPAAPVPSQPAEAPMPTAEPAPQAKKTEKKKMALILALIVIILAFVLVAALLVSQPLLPGTGSGGETGPEPRLGQSPPFDVSDLSGARVAIASLGDNTDSTIPWQPNAIKFFLIFDDGEFTEALENTVPETSETIERDIAAMLASEGVEKVVLASPGDELISEINNMGMECLSARGSISEAITDYCGFASTVNLFGQKVAIASFGSGVDSEIGFMAREEHFFLVFDDGVLVDVVENDLILSSEDLEGDVAEWLAGMGVEKVVASSVGGEFASALKDEGLSCAQSSGIISETVTGFCKSASGADFVGAKVAIAASEGTIESDVSGLNAKAPFFLVFDDGVLVEAAENTLMEQSGCTASGCPPGVDLKKEVFEWLAGKGVEKIVLDTPKEQAVSEMKGIGIECLWAEGKIMGVVAEG